MLSVSQINRNGGWLVTSSQHQTYEYDVTAGSSIRLKFCDSLCRILEKSLLFPLSPIIESFIQITKARKTGAASSSTSKQDRHSTPQSFFLRQLFGVWGGKRGGRGLRLTIRIGVSFYVAAGGPAVLNILHYSAARTRSKYELQLSARI